ncbi:hypothetical protein N4P33_15725 [Streptomyces sp. 15-116A]|uniref:hypothetical protein n=1 Tax=Streptomyces sp. 15-116A TaxID=2259035 RepID=UPI0021B28E49|nr:hypothetical protein [Streptomyces sp. 15-116A]MCT7353611.1 hypothetical protein [Streptomyces sp. 15-116A]
MPQPTRLAARYAAGDAWLADCHAHPATVWKAWHADTLAPIVSGTRWLVAESTVTRGLPAASRIRDQQRGPVLIDPYRDRSWWLVPLEAAAELDDVRQVTVKPPGWILRCPPAGREVEHLHWLWSPDGTGHLTDPAVLAAAFGPGGRRHLAEAPQ